MTAQADFTLINPQNGNLAFRLFYFDQKNPFSSVQRNNYYSLVWVLNGKGQVKADFSAYELRSGQLYAFSPYQPFLFDSHNLQGLAIHFHSDFFCIHKHASDIACTVLFNNIYEAPFVSVDEHTAATFHLMLEQVKTEMQQTALAQHELLISYLKIFLITASRLKAEQQPLARQATQDLKEPFILQHLREAIEKDFRTKHSPADYADALNISAKALAKLTKTYFNKTLSDLISERIIIEAKRELYLTNKTIKEIAHGLGYRDEYYFSRFFKTNAAISPQLYRDTVGFGRGES
ncbi:MAG TPA: helix-turn-helix domain-containing protein [Bacteroidia bacterium]|nr:helix-turn-helix domain-containing protein [Bacteroidia bacterium]